MHCYQERMNFPEGPGYGTICENVPDEEFHKYVPRKPGVKINGMADPRNRRILINKNLDYPIEYVKRHEKLHLEKPWLSEYAVRKEIDKWYNESYGIKRGRLVNSAGDYLRQRRMERVITNINYNVIFDQMFRDFVRKMRERDMGPIPGLV